MAKDWQPIWWVSSVFLDFGTFRSNDYGQAQPTEINPFRTPSVLSRVTSVSLNFTISNDRQHLLGHTTNSLRRLSHQLSDTSDCSVVVVRMGSSFFRQNILRARSCCATAKPASATWCDAGPLLRLRPHLHCSHEDTDHFVHPHPLLSASSLQWCSPCQGRLP